MIPILLLISETINFSLAISSYNKRIQYKTQSSSNPNNTVILRKFWVLMRFHFRSAKHCILQFRLRRPVCDTTQSYQIEQSLERFLP